jgi:predicted DNA-binding transcriptional regulator YafY
MVTPTTRLLTLLEILQARGLLSSRDLAERLEVDQRSVRRYVAMLQGLGLPVEGERGRHGGYRLRRGFKLPPLMFTDDEALALTLGLLGARSTGLAAAAPAVEGALAKIDRVLPETVREQVRMVQESLHLDFGLSSSAPSPASSTVLTLSRAVSERRRTLVRYQSSQGRESHRAVDVYGMVFRVGFWYVVGWCHKALAVRTFRIDRMSEVELTDQTFSLPDDFNTHEHLLRSLKEMYEPWRMEVLMDTTMEEAQRWLPSMVGSLTPTEGGVLLSSRSNNLDWMAYVLARIPWPTQVRGPAELAKTLAKLGERFNHMAATLQT